MERWIIGKEGLKREEAWNKKSMKVNNHNRNLKYRGYNLELTENGIRMVSLFTDIDTNETLTYAALIA